MIILDDIVEGYPAVMRAFHRMCKDALWFIYEMSGRMAIFRRRRNYKPFYNQRTVGVEKPVNFHPEVLNG